MFLHYMFCLKLSCTHANGNETDSFTGITLTPPSLNVATGETALFKCLLQCPYDILWKVNGTYIWNSPNDSIPGLHIVKSPIPSCVDELVNITVNISVSNGVVAYRNNLSIVCLGYYQNNNSVLNEKSSNTAFLVIKGTLGSNFN